MKIQKMNIIHVDRIPNTEEGETSYQSRKINFDEYYQQNWSHKTEEPQNPPPKKYGIPEEYTPKRGVIHYRNILNIDCSKNRKEILIEWLNEMTLLVVSKDYEGISKQDIIRLAIYKTSGILRVWLTELKQENLPGNFGP